MQEFILEEKTPKWRRICSVAGLGLGSVFVIFITILMVILVLIVVNTKDSFTAKLGQYRLYYAASDINNTEIKAGSLVILKGEDSLLTATQVKEKTILIIPRAGTLLSYVGTEKGAVSCTLIMILTILLIVIWFFISIKNLITYRDKLYFSDSYQVILQQDAEEGLMPILIEQETVVSFEKEPVEAQKVETAADFAQTK